MNRKILPALLLHFALVGCVPDEVHEQALRRNQELSRQVSAVTSTLQIVQFFTIINGGVLAACLVALWNRNRRDAHERKKISGAVHLGGGSHRSSNRLLAGQDDRSLPGRSGSQADRGGDRTERRVHHRTDNRKRHRRCSRHSRKRRPAKRRPDRAAERRREGGQAA